MATNTQKQRNIKYLNRDFATFKRDLIEHLRVYFPNNVNDFNEASSNMFLLEMMSFIGDSLSYYSDKQFEESFIQTSRNAKNVLKHARQLGFKAFGKSSATGTVDCFIKVPVIIENEEFKPDMRYAGTVKKGAQLKSNNGETYETLEDADFSKVDITDDDFIQIADRNSSSNQPISYILRLPNISIKAGETKTTTFTVGGYKAYTKLEIGEEDVLEILEVSDSEGNDWYEVDFLAQDTIFTGVANTGEDLTDVPYVLKLKSVPYRFTSNYDISTNKTSLIFGTGDAQTFDGDLIPDLSDLSLPVFGKDVFTDFSLDPQNFLKTRTLGLAPVNTTITIKYRVGGGLNTNVGSNEINTVSSSTFDIADSSLNSTTIKDVGNSFSVVNANPIQGGRDQLSLDEIKQLVSANFATQGRMVTAQDFIARTLSMPAKFGSIFRANAKAGVINKNAVELIILSKNSNGHVATAPNDLKTNLKTYLSRFRMLTNAIEILDGEIINFGVNFTILTNPDFNKSEVLANCIESLKEFFEIDKYQINQPINLTDLIVLLRSVVGVLSVVSIQIDNLIGTIEGRSYSLTPYNINENTKNGIVYCKENAIFECKFPSRDIIGVAR